MYLLYTVSVAIFYLYRVETLTSGYWARAWEAVSFPWPCSLSTARKSLSWLWSRACWCTLEVFCFSWASDVIKAIINCPQYHQVSVSEEQLKQRLLDWRVYMSSWSIDISQLFCTCQWEYRQPWTKLTLGSHQIIKVHFGTAWCILDSESM